MPRSSKYAFRLAALHAKLDPQAVGEFLDALIDEKKEHVTDEEVLAAARKPNSPLHDGFTWSDPDAAEKWRRREARGLVKSLVIEKNGKTTRTRAFVYIAHPEHDGKRVVMTMQSALGRPEMRDQLIAQEVRRFQKSLGYWGDLFRDNRGLRALVKDVERLKRRAEREFMVGV